jgi:uncharacterized protein YacL
MIIWLFRVGILIACPAIVWFGKIAPNNTGLAVGFGVGLLMIGLEYLIAELNLLNILLGILGWAGGVVLAKLVDYVVLQIGDVGLYQTWDKFALLRYFFFGVLGAVIAIRKSGELDVLDKDLLKMSRRRGADMLLLDLHAIIDGRVVDVCETRFLQGTLLVARFLQAELQKAANSEDAMRRARGRRGLDVLARLQACDGVTVKILDKDVPEISDLDGKVMRLARDMGVRVATTDFNVNKVATLEGVVCLNFNDLSMALKSVVLPGESMSVFVMKEGKEREQGVGFLDDGTMVILEDARRSIGKRVEATVTSIHQTSHGRQIFAKAKPENRERQPA